MQTLKITAFIFAALLVCQIQAEDATYSLKLNPEKAATLKSKIELDVIDPDGEKDEIRIDQTEKLAENKEISGFTNTIHHTKITVKTAEETKDEKPAEYRLDYVNQFLTFIREAVPGINIEEEEEDVIGTYNAIWFQASFYIIPPAKPVKVGESWTQDSRTWIWLPFNTDTKKMFELDADSVTEMMRGNEKILSTMTYTLTAIETIGERESAKIDFTGKTPDEEGFLTAKGFIWLDVKNGMIIKRDLEIKQTGDYILNWKFRSREIAN